MNKDKRSKNNNKYKKDKERALLEFYTLKTAFGDQALITEEHFTKVEEYLLKFSPGSEPWWEIVLKGGVAGYSLYIHELVEKRWYEKDGIDLNDLRKREEKYEDAHGEALIYEHRLLQGVARGMCYDFSLKELILRNPHGALPGDDWTIIERAHLHRLTKEDQNYNSKNTEKIKEFYEKLGFKEVNYK